MDFSMTRTTIIECSDFNLFNRFLAGEDIGSVLEQRAAVGFNTLRVWTAYQIGRIGRLIPREHPDYYAQIPAFLDACSLYGLYVEFTAFTGPYEAMFANDDEKVAHWDQLCAACATRTNVLLELVNEYDNGPNLGLPYDRLQKPAGVLSSHGSGSQDSPPKEPFWDYATWRAAAGEWQRKIGHGADEFGGAFPVITNETPRYPDNEQSLTHAYDGAAGAALLCAGSCFHSVHGKDSTLWTGLELDAAVAWTAGATSVPLDCQAGGYVHRSDLEGGQALRVYQRGQDDRCIVRIRR